MAESVTSKDNVVVVYPEHVSIRRKPRNLNPDDLPLFAGEWERKIRETHVLTIANARVLNGIIFRLSSLRFYTSYTYPGFDAFGIKSVALKGLIAWKLSGMLRLRKSETLMNGVWIADRRSHEYFHWLTDALPRLVAARPSLVSHPVLLPELYKKYPYIAGSLAFFNIPVEYCGASVRVKELILPSHTALSGNYNKTIIQKLREIFLSGLKSIEPQRLIYISRKKALKRKVANEDEVIAVLEKFGYEIHYFEDYNFAKQVQICSQTKSLIGLHGAGLTNMLFMPAGGNVLEIRNDADASNNCYFTMASDLDLDYFYQLSTGDSKDTHTVNVRVDVDVLTRNLEQMMPGTTPAKKSAAGT